MTDKERLEEIKEDIKMTRKDLSVSPSNEMTLQMDIMLNSMDYLIGRVQELERFKEYFDELYGRGLEVAEWHLNGGLEPFDNFYVDAIDYMEGEELFMTDKERLEEIKNDYKPVYNGLVNLYYVTEKDYLHLIEQAQRVQELEDIIYQDARQAVLEGLYEENKRYREALERIAYDDELLSNTDDIIAAKEALEETK